jgi:hypothetical protein
MKKYCNKGGGGDSLTAFDSVKCGTQGLTFKYFTYHMAQHCMPEELITGLETSNFTKDRYASVTIKVLYIYIPLANTTVGSDKVRNIPLIYTVFPKFRAQKYSKFHFRRSLYIVLG